MKNDTLKLHIFETLTDISLKINSFDLQIPHFRQHYNSMIKPMLGSTELLEFTR